ncbi:MAG: Rnase Y domain-containing protein [Candidatus Altimarinota bacterium]
MSDPTFLISILALFGGGSAAGYFLFRPNSQAKREQAEQQIQNLHQQAQQEAEQTKRSISERIAQFQNTSLDLDRRLKLIEEKSQKSQAVLEERLKSREQENKKVETELFEQNAQTIKLDEERAKIKQEKVPRLVSIAKTSVENLKADLIQDLNNDLELARELRLNKQEEVLKEEAPQIAKNLLIEAIQKYSASTSVEKKNLTIPISRDETRLRLIGKDAEIFNYLEEQLGVDIFFDVEKGGLVVSHFELVKRHIARETLVKLMKDRVINIEKVKMRLEETTFETKRLLVEIGNRVVQKLELEHRHFPPEFKEILGRLKYRTSYGQNILKHCFEVGYFTLMLGGELGLSTEVCKIGGFFHDLGKAIDQEDGRPHDILTKEIMERFNIFSWEEVHAAWTHHDAIPIETPEALLVKAADAISAGRPGARQETIEKYLARIMAIESIAKSKSGVKKTYAISGGRELRVIVDPQRLKDEDLIKTANQIAEEIEANVAYPGQIKVNVIRRVQKSQTIKEKSHKSLKS